MTDYSKNAIGVTLDETHSNVNINELKKFDFAIFNGGAGSDITAHATDHIQECANANIPCIMDWYVILDLYETMDKNKLPEYFQETQVQAINRVVFSKGVKRTIHALRLFVYTFSYSDGNQETQSNLKKIAEHLRSMCVDLFGMPVLVVIKQTLLDTKTKSGNVFSKSGDELQNWLSNMEGTDPSKSWVCSTKNSGVTAGVIDFDNIPRPGSDYVKPYIANASLCHFFGYANTAMTAPWGDKNAQVSIPLTMYQSPAETLYQWLGFTKTTDTTTPTDDDDTTDTTTPTADATLDTIAAQITALQADVTSLLSIASAFKNV
jgi:hypothetical protein